MDSILTVDLATFKEAVDRYEKAVALADQLLTRVEAMERGRLLNLSEVAAKFGVVESTILYYETKRLLPYRIASRGPMWEAGQIDDWVRTRPVNFHRKER